MAFSSNDTDFAGNSSSDYKLNKDFYSGSQASIFIGDVWLDDICGWQIQTNFSAAPIYGYGDQLYSHVAQGKVLVQGSFEINFREPNYLWAILEKYNFDRNVKTQDDPLAPVRSGGLGTAKFNQSEASFAADRRRNLDFFFNTSQPNKITKALQEERSISQKPYVDNSVDFNQNTFDILLGYGAVLNEDTPGERVLGVKLIGKSKVIYHNGNPIKEQYNFFARNIV